MVSNENNLKFEPAEQKNVYKAGGTFGSTNTPQVNDKLDEMKKKNITHISSDVLFSKNETYFFKKNQKFTFFLNFLNFFKETMRIKLTFRSFQTLLLPFQATNSTGRKTLMKMTIRDMTVRKFFESGGFVGIFI